MGFIFGKRKPKTFDEFIERVKEEEISDVDVDIGYRAVPIYEGLTSEFPTTFYVNKCFRVRGGEIEYKVADLYPVKTVRDIEDLWGFAPHQIWVKRNEIRYLETIKETKEKLEKSDLKPKFYEVPIYKYFFGQFIYWEMDRKKEVPMDRINRYINKIDVLKSQIEKIREEYYYGEVPPELW